MGKKSPKVVARKLISFAEVIGTRRLIRATVGPGNDLLLLSLESTANDVESSRPRINHVNRFSIHFQAGDDWIETCLPETSEYYHHVQPLGKDHWLTVRARSEGDHDENAHVFNASGRLIRSVPAGDGIQDVQTDEAGKIWVSYFDEGVFGNTKLGKSGLVGLDEHGRCVFDFLNVPHTCVESMADCYALNVSSSRDVWLCYYTGFPLVHLRDNKLADVWPQFPISGSPAFAIHGTRSLFAGGYHDREALFIVALDALRPREIIPMSEQGERISKFASFGRRSSLFLHTKETLYAIDLATLASVD